MLDFEGTDVQNIVESIKNGEAGRDIQEIEEIVKGLSEESRNEIYRAFFWYVDVPLLDVEDVA